MTSAVADRDGAMTRVTDADLDDNMFERALRSLVVGWDIETTGLDWRKARIATVQVYVGDTTAVVRLNGRVPSRLKALLEDPTVMKIMHHAMFDLRFMAHHWDAAPRKVACTKIAAKLAHPGMQSEAHSLASLVLRYFGARLDKSQRITDWTAPNLDASQIAYAADDVRYLWRLFEQLDDELRQKGLLSLRDRCYAHLATRVELELRGYPDVFEY